MGKWQIPKSYITKERWTQTGGVFTISIIMPIYYIDYFQKTLIHHLVYTSLLSDCFEYCSYNKSWIHKCERKRHRSCPCEVDPETYLGIKQSSRSKTLGQVHVFTFFFMKIPTHAVFFQLLTTYTDHRKVTTVEDLWWIGACNTFNSFLESSILGIKKE